ncbi:MAG: hypothetical protein ACRD0C_14495 [Acidimicrobiia bacterium]
MKKLIVAALMSGMVALGAPAMAQLVSVSDILGPVNGANVGDSEQNNPSETGGGGGGGLVSVTDVVDALNILNIGQSLQNNDGGSGSTTP